MTNALRVLSFLMCFSLDVGAKTGPYPRGTEPVCFVIVDENFEHPEIMKAIAVNGMVEGLKIPDGKFILREVKCHE